MKPSRHYLYWFRDATGRVIAEVDYHGEPIPLEPIRAMGEHIHGAETVEEYGKERVKL